MPWEDSVACVSVCECVLRENESESASPVLVVDNSLDRHIHTLSRSLSLYTHTCVSARAAISCVDQKESFNCLLSVEFSKLVPEYHHHHLFFHLLVLLKYIINVTLTVVQVFLYFCVAIIFAPEISFYKTPVELIFTAVRKQGHLIENSFSRYFNSKNIFLPLFSLEYKQDLNNDEVETLAL